MTVATGDAVAFDRFLDASTPEVGQVARALHLAVVEAFPDARLRAAIEAQIAPRGQPARG